MQTFSSSTDQLNSTQVKIALGFHALSDPLRIRVLELLRHRELCVCDLCDLVSVKQSKLSFHLKALREAELVRTRQQGRWIYYSLNLPQFVILEQYLADYRRFYDIVPASPCSD
jgi:ArsR family transcriptional regulator